MLTKDIRIQIEELVRNKPSTIQEIARTIDKNWRTADRYVQQISEEFGTIATRTFREGSRGALKLAYWNALGTKSPGTAYQDRLKTMIDAGRTKYDFSPMNIYQFAAQDKRLATIRHDKNLKQFLSLFEKTQRQTLFFSGNLSWMHDDPKILPLIEALLKRGVKMKILTRVDLTSARQVQQLLKHNVALGDDVISIRHCEQPLRGCVFDDTIISIKEVYSPARQAEIREQTIVYYQINDSVWINWLQKIFWHLWEQSIDASNRIDAMQTIKKEK